jgi:hypothetical protein
MRLVLAAVLTTLAVPFAPPADAVTTTATLVAFAADTDGDGINAIYTRPADGSAAPAPVFSSPDDLWSPALSPDGTRIAYVEANTTDWEYSVWVRPSNGSGTATRLTTGVDDDAPSWSRDGTTIAFTRGSLAAGDRAVWTVPADGSAAETKVAGSERSGHPRFSPSGRQLLVDRFDDDGNPVGLDLLTLFSHTRVAIPGTAGGYQGAWSPDGQKIAFVTGIACGTAILSLPVSGAATPAVVRSVAGRWADSPQFSNDGTQLFWNETPDDCVAPTQPSDTYAAAADGTGAAPIGATPAFDETFLSVAGGTLAADTTVPAAAMTDANGVIEETSATIAWTTGPDVTESIVVRLPHGAPAPLTPAGGTFVYDGAGHSATATGLTAGTAYDLYVFAADASGNFAPVSAAHPVRPNAVPTISAPPLVSSVSAGVRFPVSWSGAAPLYGVRAGERTHASDGWSAAPVYTSWYASTALTSSTFTGAQGHTYYFAVRALDEFGNATAYSGAAAATVPFNETYPAIAYTSGWSTGSAPSRWMSTLRWHTAPGAALTYKVDTAAFTVVGDRCWGCGLVRVYVDGVLKATVDTRATTTQVRQVLYAGPVLPGGIVSHTIRLVVVGTAGRPRIAIDGIATSR